jgi:hypothetical protein
VRRPDRLTLDDLLDFRARSRSETWPYLMYLTLLSGCPDPAHQQAGAKLAGLSGESETLVVGVC